MDHLIVLGAMAVATFLRGVWDGAREKSSLPFTRAFLAANENLPIARRSIRRPGWEQKHSAHLE